MTDGAEDLAEPADELEQLRRRNAGHLQRLAMSGVNVIQLAWEQRAASVLEEIDREVRLAQLRAGGIGMPNGHG